MKAPDGSRRGQTPELGIILRCMLQAATAARRGRKTHPDFQLLKEQPSPLTTFQHHLFAVCSRKRSLHTRNLKFFPSFQSSQDLYLVMRPPMPALIYGLRPNSV